jgi:coenzyme F420-reducing hydrogenase delta subunit
LVFSTNNISDPGIDLAGSSHMDYLPDCTDRTASIVQKAQDLLKEHGLDPRRLKMAAICSVCSESFVSHMEKFHKALSELKT